MSKFFLTNNQNKFQSASKQISQQRSHTLFGGTGNLQMIVLDKFVTKQYKNNYIIDDNNYVVGVGTLIYKNDIGAGALRKLYEDFNGDVATIKKSCIGIYNLVIVKGDIAWIFNDYYGIYDLFYSNQDSDYIVSSKLADIAQFNNNIDHNGALLELFFKGFNEDTPFKGVTRLLENQYITIKNGKFNIELIPEDHYAINYSYTSTEQTAKDISLQVDKITTLINTHFHKQAVCITGGLDSRLTLSVMLKADIKPYLVHGSSSSMLLSIDKEDGDVAKLLADRFSLELDIIDWSHQYERIDSDINLQRDIFKEIGFQNRVYYGNENFLAFLKQENCKQYDFLDFGYFLESFRLREFAQELGRDTFSLKEFVFDYCIGSDNPLRQNKEFCDYFYSIWDKKCDELNFKDKDAISIDKFETLRWFSARKADSVSAQITNEYTYSFPIFADPYIHDVVLSVPAADIRDSKFQINFIESIYPESLNFPLVSHRRFYTIKNGVKVPDLNTKNIADKVIKLMPFIKPLLYSVYRRFIYRNQDGIDNKLRRDIKELSEPYTKNTGFDISSIRVQNTTTIASIRQFLIGYNILKK